MNLIFPMASMVEFLKKRLFSPSTPGKTSRLRLLLSLYSVELLSQSSVYSPLLPPSAFLSRLHLLNFGRSFSPFSRDRLVLLCVTALNILSGCRAIFRPYFSFLDASSAAFPSPLTFTNVFAWFSLAGGWRILRYEPLSRLPDPFAPSILSKDSFLLAHRRSALPPQPS